MSGKRKLQVVISVGALLLSARLPLAAQLSASHFTGQSTGTPASQSAPVTISSPSPIGDTTALAKEAQGWLIDLIRTNTTNPPGNEAGHGKIPRARSGEGRHPVGAAGFGARSQRAGGPFA